MGPGFDKSTSGVTEHHFFETLGARFPRVKLYVEDQTDGRSLEEQKQGNGDLTWAGKNQRGNCALS